MPPSNSPQVVVTDANVLINLMHAGRLDLLGALTAFEFVVPDHVVAEITVPVQRQALEIALTRSSLSKQSITDPGELATYAELRRIMGSGEAACLAMAEARGWLIASDEKRRFRREVIAQLGEGRLVTTAGLFVIAIRAGVISVEQADQIKELLQATPFSHGLQVLPRTARPAKNGLAQISHLLPHRPPRIENQSRPLESLPLFQGDQRNWLRAILINYCCQLQAPFGFTRHTHRGHALSGYPIT